MMELEWGFQNGRTAMFQTAFQLLVLWSVEAMQILALLVATMTFKRLFNLPNMALQCRKLRCSPQTQATTITATARVDHGVRVDRDRRRSALHLRPPTCVIKLLLYHSDKPLACSALYKSS